MSVDPITLAAILAMAVVTYATPCVYQAAGHAPELIFDSESHGISGMRQRIRALFREGERHRWSDWNADAVAEWLWLNGA